ncbi:hypothetical protein HYPGJ_40134 [Hyphomicrobium sp. GJ21]|nr:hypothetical protein HYPGJ_40134 [Hyphomicrobium sp. GJ21]
MCVAGVAVAKPPGAAIAGADKLMRAAVSPPKIKCVRAMNFSYSGSSSKCLRNGSRSPVRLAERSIAFKALAPIPGETGMQMLLTRSAAKQAVGV